MSAINYYIYIYFMMIIYMTSIEIYFNKLKDMVLDKELNDFWLLCDRSDFKPIKYHSIIYILIFRL